MKINIKDSILFLLSMFLGCLIWLLSSYFTGLTEPWDAENAYYFICLIIAGFIPGFLGKKRFWLWPIAIYLGQFIYILVYSFIKPVVGANFFIPLGMFFLGIYSILSFIGSFIGVVLRKVSRIS